ncbi:MAG: hypothetical protein ACT4PZ_16755 [Panacagrimonas sp.]
MSEIVLSGRIVDWVLALIALEALALWAYHRRTAGGIAATDLLANLASGFCLLLALRAALTDQSWVWVAAALAASLFGHLLDLSRRWKRRPELGSAANDSCRNMTDQRFNGRSGKKL